MRKSLDIQSEFVFAVLMLANEVINSDLVHCHGFVHCVRKVTVHLGYGPYIWLSVPQLPLQCAAVSLYSVLKQWLNCNTGKVCNCLVQFLLTVVLSIEERVLISAQQLSERTVLLYSAFGMSLCT
jgi:hypothetical protein